MPSWPAFRPAGLILAVLALWAVLPVPAVSQSEATQRAKLARLRQRLEAFKRDLAAQLVASYKQDQPDIVSLVIASHSFGDLIERVEYVKRLQQRNGEIVARVHA